MQKLIKHNLLKKYELFFKLSIDKGFLVCYNEIEKRENNLDFKGGKQMALPLNK